MLLPHISISVLLPQFNSSQLSSATSPLCFLSEMNLKRVTKPPYSGVAREILESDTGLLELNTQKLRNSYEAELQTCVRHGTCETRLWLLLSTWRRHAAGHTKAIEGTNSMIKQQGIRAPSISLELLNARIGLKKALLADSHREAKWSDVRGHVAGVMRQCLASECEMRDVLADQARWQPPVPKDPRLPAAPAAKKSASELWAASYSLAFHRMCKKPAVGDMLLIESGGAALAGICASKHHSCVCLVLCDLQKAEHETTAVLRNPLQFENSVSMFEKLFDATQAGDCPLVSWAKVEWNPAFAMGTGRLLESEAAELFYLTRDRAKGRVPSPQATRRRQAAAAAAGHDSGLCSMYVVYSIHYDSSMTIYYIL